MKGMINNKCNNKVKKQISIFLAVLILSFPIALAAEISKPLTYDPNGNIVQDTDKYYEYDSLNQLTKVRENNQDGRILEEYVYGSDGDRIKKVTHKNDNSQTTTYYVDGNFIRVVNSSGTYDTKYYYNDGQLIAEEKPDGSKNYYHPDHLGSTNLITDQIAQVVEETSYLPFGEAFEGGESRFTFTGKERDSTDLMYYGARYYSPLLKSFTQPDTIIQDIYDPQTLNRYAYVRNNPIKYTDPTGNVAWLAPMAVGATIGALVGGGISLGYQLWQNGGNFGQVDWGAVGKSTLIGAVGGATFGLVSSAGAAAIGAAKLSGISALLAEGGTIAVGGMTSGQAYRATENVLEGRDVTEGLGRPEDMMLDAGSALLGWGAGRGISIASGKSGKSLTSNPSKSSDSSSRKVVVIGQGGDKNVVPYAKKTGAEYYNPRKSWREIGTDKAVRNNVNWVTKKIRQGYVFEDLGPDPGLTHRPYYPAERAAIKRAFQSGKEVPYKRVLANEG